MRLRGVALCIAALLCWLPSAHAQTDYTLSSGSLTISGTSTLHDWTVKSGKATGHVVFKPSQKNPQKYDGLKGIIESGEISLDVISIKSDKGEPMDAKIYKALKSESDPQITLVVKAIAFDCSKSPAKISVNATVAVAGVTKSMDFLLNVNCENGNQFHIAGSKALKMSDFDIEPPSAMFGQIETSDPIEIKFDIVFIAKK